MVTFKKLGCMMYRNEKGGWFVESRDYGLRHEGTGNKGQVMSQALATWENAGLVQFNKGTGWNRVSKE